MQQIKIAFPNSSWILRLRRGQSQSRIEVELLWNNKDTPTHSAAILTEDLQELISNEVVATKSPFEK